MSLSDSPESYAAMSTEALNMAHCCDAFLNGFQAFVLNVFVAEKIEDNMTSRSRWEIFGNGSHWHGDYVLRDKAHVEM